MDASYARQINAFIQQQLRDRCLQRVVPVEAARWLDEAGVLKDTGKPGQRLRDYLRAGLIQGAFQLPNGRWVINRV